MKTKYFVLAGLTILFGAIISLSVYAEKEHKAKEMKLPDPVMAAVQMLYPQAAVEEAKMEKEGIMLYAIEAKQGDQEYDLTIAPDGTLVEDEQEIGIETLPASIQQQITGADVEEISKEVKYYVVVLKKLDAPEVSYSVELKKGGEMEFSADGTLVKQEMNSHDEGDDDDEHHKAGKDDDDEDEDDE